MYQKRHNNKKEKYAHKTQGLKESTCTSTLWISHTFVFMVYYGFMYFYKISNSYKLSVSGSILKLC